MECAQSDWIDNKEYLQRLRRKVTQERIPLTGSIDVTHRCNLRCVHCYLGEEESHWENRNKETSTAQWISIIDEMTEAGCLYLLMSGGEPLIRKDFVEIYSHAKTNGLLVTVFTNGTLITDRVLELFEDLPPHIVEISLYGATAATYERVSRVKGSYEKCVRGIQRLMDIKTNLKLKTILMTYNRHEFYEIEDMARDWGLAFRFDPAIFPCFNGDKTPMHLRVSPQEAIEKEFSDEARMRQWRDYFERMRGNPASETLYECGAGLMSFHIDPYGALKPCLMVNSPRVDVSGGGFLTGWRDVIPRISEKQVDREFPCHKCEKRTLCGFCPAFFELENGSEDIRSEYLCAIAQSRFQAIENLDSGENHHDI